MLLLLFSFIHFFFRLTELGSFQNTLMKAINSSLKKNIKNLYGKYSFPCLVFFLSVRINLISVFLSWRGISNISRFLGMRIQLHMVAMVTLYSSSVAYHTAHQTVRTLLSEVGWLILDFPVNFPLMPSLPASKAEPPFCAALPQLCVQGNNKTMQQTSSDLLEFILACKAWGIKQKKQS